MARKITEGVKLALIRGIFFYQGRNEDGTRYYLSTGIKSPKASENPREYALAYGKAIEQAEKLEAQGKQVIKSETSLKDFVNNLFKSGGIYESWFMEKNKEKPSPLTTRGLKTGGNGIVSLVGESFKLKDFTKQKILNLYEQIQDDDNVSSKYKALVKILFFLDLHSGTKILGYLPKMQKIKPKKKSIISDKEFLYLQKLNQNNPELINSYPRFRTWVFCLLAHETGMRLCELRGLQKQDLKHSGELEGLLKKNQETKIETEIQKGLEQGKTVIQSNLQSQKIIYYLEISRHYQGRILSSSDSGKGKKRLVNLSLRTAMLLTELTQGLKEEDFLFPISERNLQKDFQDLMETVTNKQGLTPHSARHFFQSYLPGKSLKDGTQILPFQVSSMLGHELPGAKMQGIYFHQTPETCAMIGEYFLEVYRN